MLLLASDVQVNRKLPVSSQSKWTKASELVVFRYIENSHRCFEHGLLETPGQKIIRIFISSLSMEGPLAKSYIYKESTLRVKKLTMGF